LHLCEGQRDEVHARKLLELSGAFTFSRHLQKTLIYAGFSLTGNKKSVESIRGSFVRRLASFSANIHVSISKN
jgi:hypothetical protein